MRTPFDLLAIVIVILTQWHMRRQFLAAAGRRLSARALTIVHWAVTVFYVLMAVGFAAGFSFLASEYRLPASPSQIAGAVAQIWLFGSTAGYMAYRAVRFLAERVAAEKEDCTALLLLAAPGDELPQFPELRPYPDLQHSQARR